MVDTTMVDTFMVDTKAQNCLFAVSKVKCFNGERCRGSLGYHTHAVNLLELEVFLIKDKLTWISIDGFETVTIVL